MADRALGGALLAAALVPLNSTMVAVAVPDVARTVEQAPGTVTQALVSTYLIAAIALQGPGGKLGDRLGHWRVCLLGQAAMGLGAVAGVVATGLPALAGSRILMAAGGALVVPATLALLRLELPPERRGRAFGTFGATMASAAALGPIVGGLVVDGLGWRAVFVVNVPVLLLSAVLVLGAHRRRDARPVEAFDWAGSVLLAGALTLLVLGAQRSDRSALPLLAGGCAVIGAFAWQERRAADPVLDLMIFRHRSFTAGTVLIGLQNFVMYALLFEVPLVLGELFDLSASGTGRLLVLLTGSTVVVSLVAGRLTDALGPRALAVAGTALCLLSTTLLLLSHLDSVGEVRLPLVLLGAGLGLCGPPGQTAALSSIASERSGMAAGASSTMRYLGGVAGIALLGRVLDLDGSAADVRSSHHVVVAVFTGVLLVALGCAAVLPGRRAEVPAPTEVLRP